ncbi:MAG: heme o synthase [Fidelibacterota bacterium]
MKTERTPATNILSALLELTKPRIMVMVLVTTTFSFILAGGHFSSPQFLYLLLGTALVKGGAGALNHYGERHTDGLMERTRTRPLPAGILTPFQALQFGLGLSLAGVGILYIFTNGLTAVIATLTVILYTLVYTPLKRKTWLNTSIGAIPGALPAMGGWTAATDQLDMGAWIMFAILFFWQHPHFYAIAIMYREDYARADLRMLPVVDKQGRSTILQILVHSLLLLLVSILPVFWHISGLVYLLGALLLGWIYLRSGLLLSHAFTMQNARALLLSSVLYLPALLLLIIIDAFLPVG